MSRYFDKETLPTWEDMKNLSGKWEIYQRLVEGVPADARARKLMLGDHWTYVQADSGIGAAMTVRGGAAGMRLDRSVDGMPLRDLAALSTSWSFTEASIGVAALNAWYSSPEVTRENGIVLETPENSSFDVYKRLIAGKRVTIVGHFPLIERLGDTCDLTILERAPQPGDIPDPACEFIVGEQDYLFMTGITLQNKTMPRLLELARVGGTEAIVVGPSVVPAPVLFDYGVVCLAGSVFAPGREQEAKTAMEQGSHSAIFKHGLQKMRLEKPGWSA